MKHKGVISLLVIDGLGVGAMEDVAWVRPQDYGAHTLRSIDTVYHSRILDGLGFYDLMSPKTFRFDNKNLRIGRCGLDYDGADSFLSHNYIIGNKVKLDTLYFVADYFEEIKAAFATYFDISMTKGIISLDDCVFIANNIEADPGSTINVVGSLAHMSFDKIKEIGQVVARVIQPMRTIVMAGKPFDNEIVYSNIVSVQDTRGNNVFGIDIPRTGIYNDYYQVLHIGKNTEGPQHLLSLLKNHRYSIALFGKSADLFGSYGDCVLNAVSTDTVLSALNENFLNRQYSFVFANVQEIDLSGHAQDLSMCEKVMHTLDKKLPTILKNMGDNDVLIITADHGNDPCIGHSKHTREYVPVVIIGANIERGYLGIRTNLSDIGATVADLFEISTEMGESLLHSLQDLSEKQLVIYQLFQTDTLSILEVSKQLKGSIPMATLKQALSHLVYLKLLERIGMGRGSRYKKL